jgi:hypothetical protein
MPELDAQLWSFVLAHVGEPARVEPIGGDHEDADVWRIDTASARVYLKRPHHGGLVARERSAYRALAPRLGDVLPELLASADPPVGALLLSEARGVPYREAALSHEHELAVHRRLGEIRRRFDAAPVDHDPVDAAEAVARRMRHWLARANAVDAALRSEIQRAFDPRPLRGMPRVWCHRDLGLHNVRIDRETGELRVRIVDLGRARPDVWLVDLLELSIDPWPARPELATAFFAGYGREPTARERDGLRALSLLHALATATWGDQHGDPTRSALGRAELDRLLTR